MADTTTTGSAHERGAHERAVPRHATATHGQADKPQASPMEADKKRLAEEREKRASDQLEREKKRGTPTPTQEECDLAKLGYHPQLADDGSGPDPNDKLNTVAHIGGGAPYATRQMQAAKP